MRHHPSTGLQTEQGHEVLECGCGLSNTIAIAESAGRPFVYVRGRKVGGANALTDLMLLPQIPID